MMIRSIECLMIGRGSTLQSTSNNFGIIKRSLFYLMKRSVKVKTDCYTIIDDEGTLAVSQGTSWQIIDVESKIKASVPIDKPIKLMIGNPYLTIGIDGCIYIRTPKKDLIQYLFPVGYENATPTCVTYSVDTTLVAVGLQNIVLVYDLNKKLEQSLIALLEGHEAPIVKCSFLSYPGYEHLLVSCSEDQRFIVWDLNKRCMQYESPFESSYPIKAISSFNTHHYFAIAFEDGYVRLYDASPILDAKPSVKFMKMINCTKAEFDEDEEEEAPSIIISKTKAPKPPPKPDFSGETPPAIISGGSTSMHGREFMLCATENSVISLNVATFEREVVHTFDQPVTTAVFDNLIVAAQTSFSNVIQIKRLTIGMVPELGLQLFPEDDAPPTSPLLVDINLKTKQAAPIETLHKTVKSSGYNQKPPPSKYSKKTAAAGKKGAKPKKSVEPPPIVLNFKVPKTVTNTFTPLENPLSTASLSPDGKRLICADSNGTIVFVKQKVTNLPAYLGHSQPVTSLSWNTSKGFISSSLDRTVKFWDINRPDPLLTISKTKGDTRGNEFPEDISGSGYFWNDKFVTIAYGSNLGLYGYHLPSLNMNAKTVADMHQTGTYKLIKNLSIDTGKIISLSASNMPMSPIALVATTTKTIHAFDFYTGQKVLDIESQHERPIHSIVANFGGIFTPREETTPDLLLSGALDETFKLWDLRSARCERTMIAGSRTVKVGMCFSPDSKYVALGTERLGVEIWDIGQGTCVQKLKDELRGTTVTWMQWNPQSGRLQCGNENGVIKIFG